MIHWNVRGGGECVSILVSSCKGISIPPLPLIASGNSLPATFVRVSYLSLSYLPSYERGESRHWLTLENYDLLGGHLIDNIDKRPFPLNETLVDQMFI